MKHFFRILFVLVFISGCTPGKVFEKHIKFDNLSWNRFEVLEFEVPIKDVSVEYDILIAIRHIPEIPYNVIEVGSTIITPSGETRSLEHRVRIRDKDGELVGDGMGDLWDVKAPLRSGFRFDSAGTSKIELNNYMTKLETPGIIEVGLIVKKSDQ